MSGKIASAVGPLAQAKKTQKSIRNHLANLMSVACWRLLLVALCALTDVGANVDCVILVTICVLLTNVEANVGFTERSNLNGHGSLFHCARESQPSMLVKRISTAPLEST